jgi:hypothetical protein
MESTNSSHKNFIHTKDSFELGPVLENHQEENNNISKYNNAQTISVSKTENYNKNNSDNFDNYDNISQVKNKGITQPEPNIFHICAIPASKSIKCLSIFFLIAGISGILLLVTYIIERDQIYYLLKIIFAICSTIMCLSLFYTFAFKFHFIIYFILDDNGVTIEKKAFCQSIKTVYKQGELIEVKFSYSSFSNNKYVYKLELILSDNKSIFLINNTPKIELFTPQEINYFLHIVNKHIQKLMKSK